MELLKQFLDVLLNIGLFVTVAVLLFLDSLEMLIFLASLLPIELEVNVASAVCDVEWGLFIFSLFLNDFLNNGLLDLQVCYTLQFWVLDKVLSNDFNRNISQ
jgi:hypothetical protein